VVLARLDNEPALLASVQLKEPESQLGSAQRELELACRVLDFLEEPGLSLTIKMTVHNPICKYNLQRNENYIQILAIPDLPSRRRSEPSKNLTTTPTKE
jgi:hypothetical protein